MNSNMCFAICSIFYMILMGIIFFSKERLKNNENKIYSLLIVITLIELCIEIGSTILNCYIVGFETLKLISLKLINISFLTWIFTFSVYIYYVSKKTDKNRKTPIIITYLVLAVITFVLPLFAKVEDGVIKYTYGPSADFLYVLSGILIIACVILMLKNYKHVKKRKYIPLLVFIIIDVTIATIQLIFPDLLIISSAEAFITILMYFTIENPDVQMIRELYKNKKIIEKSNEDTSKFIFRMTQDIKKPVKDMITISRDMINMKDVGELVSASKYINNYANQIDYLMNKALNISNMDTQKIKVFDTRYNVNNLFKEISFRAKEDIKSNIKFDFNISSNIPKYLYGDSIKLKQAISSVINIANDFTKEGFISLDVSSIVRYNMCRLIITIEDSGKGIGIDRINQILSLTGDDLKDLADTNSDDRKLDILAVKKIVNMLGGSLMIKSEEEKGTTVTIILEQKVVETKETELSKKLENYEQSLYGEKQVLIVDDDEKELGKLEKQISADGIMVSSSVYGRECIEKVRSKLKYDLIILDDDLGSTSALEVLKELQKIKNFKTPVIVMINDNKEGIKLQYLKDGFADTISKSKLESEVDRVMKRF